MSKIKDKLREWLEVPDQIEPPTISKDVQETIRKLNSELDFWKRWFKSRATKKKCTVCRKEIDLWPFNENTAYYIRGNRVTHASCRENKLDD